MLKKIGLILLSLLFAGMIISPAQAQLKNANTFSGLAEKTFSGTFNTDVNVQKTVASSVGEIIGIALSFIGVILLVIMVYAGFLWLTAGGNDQQIDRAKKWIINSIIGMIIALSAYAISFFVINQVNKALTASATGEMNVGETTITIAVNS